MRHCEWAEAAWSRRMPWAGAGQTADDMRPWEQGRPRPAAQGAERRGLALLMVLPRWQCAPTSSRLLSALIWSRNHCRQEGGGKCTAGAAAGVRTRARRHAPDRNRWSRAGRGQVASLWHSPPCSATQPRPCLQVGVADAELGARQASGHVGVHLHGRHSMASGCWVNETTLWHALAPHPQGCTLGSSVICCLVWQRRW